MAPIQTNLDENLKNKLERLRSAPPLDAEKVAQERARFLAQGAEFRAAVSQANNRRHNRWINAFIFAFQRKERIPMLNTLMAILITMTLLFGGAGATAYASQDSLPDEPLYAVKTWSENFRLALAGSAEEQLALTLNFTDRRVSEIAGLQAEAKPVSDAVALRLQQELDAALQLAAGMEDAQLAPALTQIRQQAEMQTQTVATLLGEASGQPTTEEAPRLMHLHERLQEQVRLATAGVSDPQGFRQQVRDRDRQNRPTQTPQPTQSQPTAHTPMRTPHPTDDERLTETPGHNGTGEPDPSRTPLPTGAHNGPGPHDNTTTCTPMQDGGGPGPGPDPSSTPQPGGGPGPGPDPSGTPQPGGGPGPGPNPSGTPQPGGGGPGGSMGTPEQTPGHGGGGGGGGGRP